MYSISVDVCLIDRGCIFDKTYFLFDPEDPHDRDMVVVIGSRDLESSKLAEGNIVHLGDFLRENEKWIHSVWLVEEKGRRGSNDLSSFGKDDATFLRKLFPAADKYFFYKIQV